MIRRFLHVGFLSCVAGLASVPSDLMADDVPTFRGTDRTSVYNGKKLLHAWPEGGPKLLWEGSGAGRGYASPAVVGDKMYTLGDGLSTVSDKDEYLTCFDRSTGKQLWRTKTGEPWMEGQESWRSSRGTPTVDSGLVYVVTPKGNLVCCDAASGTEKWRKDLKADFGGKKADSWGYSESPLVDGNLLLCTPGGETNTIVALDKTSGKTVWSCKREGDIGAGHASIVISKVGGTKVYVQTTGSGGFGVSKDGKLLWQFPIDKTTAVIPTPIVRDDLVYIPVGYGRGSALVKQKAAANGEVTIETIYNLNVKLANKHGGAILVDDYIYCDSDDKGIPLCADFKTGEIKWQNRGPGKGSAVVIAGDGMLFIQFADGTLSLVHASPGGFQEAGSFKLPGSGERPSWAHPVIVDGKLYVRQQDKILCYDIAG